MSSAIAAVHLRGGEGGRVGRRGRRRAALGRRGPAGGRARLVAARRRVRGEARLERLRRLRRLQLGAVEQVAAVRHRRVDDLPHRLGKAGGGLARRGERREQVIEVVARGGAAARREGGDVAEELRVLREPRHRVGDHPVGGHVVVGQDRRVEEAGGARADGLADGREHVRRVGAVERLLEVEGAVVVVAGALDRRARHPRAGVVVHHEGEPGEVGERHLRAEGAGDDRVVGARHHHVAVVLVAPLVVRVVVLVGPRVLRHVRVDEEVAARVVARVAGVDVRAARVRRAHRRLVVAAHPVVEPQLQLEVDGVLAVVLALEEVDRAVLDVHVARVARVRVEVAGGEVHVDGGRRGDEEGEGGEAHRSPGGAFVCRKLRRSSAAFRRRFSADSQRCVAAIEAGLQFTPASPRAAVKIELEAAVVAPERQQKEPCFNSPSLPRPPAPAAHRTPSSRRVPWWAPTSRTASGTSGWLGGPAPRRARRLLQRTGRTRRCPPSSARDCQRRQRPSACSTSAPARQQRRHRPWPARPLTLIPTDVLARSTTRRSRASLEPRVRTQYCPAEAIARCFAPDYFDMVTSFNALDHAQAPSTASSRCSPCSPGGSMVLSTTRTRACSRAARGCTAGTFTPTRRRAGERQRLVAGGHTPRCRQRVDLAARLRGRATVATHAPWSSRAAGRNDSRAFVVEIVKAAAS